MTVPLPGGCADELMRHMANCPQCRLSKVYPSAQRCERGNELVRETLAERHGEMEER
jgi:hypothetical protein